MWNYFSKPLLLNHSKNYLRKFLIISGKDVSPGGLTPKKTIVQTKKLKTDSSDESCTHLIDQRSLWKKEKSVSQKQVVMKTYHLNFNYMLYLAFPNYHIRKISD